MRRNARLFGFLVGASVVAGVIGTPQSTRAAEASWLGDRLAQVGGRSVHVHCAGSGAPTTVVATGSGDMVSDWKLVFDSVARTTRICGVDRAGYGLSEPGPAPRSLIQVVSEMRNALSATGERGPFVIVGHSYGGFVARRFIEAYPLDVAGAVLVESVQENQTVPLGGGRSARIRDLATGLPIPPPHSGPPFVAATPGSITAENLPHDLAVLPPAERASSRWGRTRPAYGATVANEVTSAQEDARRWGDSGNLGTSPLADRPLIVLVRAHADDVRMNLNRDLARTSRRGELRVAHAADHDLYLSDPASVTAAIVHAVRAQT